MKSLLQLVLLILILITSCSEKKPIWSDEFDYTGSPDTGKWSYDMGVVLKGFEGIWMNTGRQPPTGL